MKRPILVAVIGYIIGIIMGLYFKISIVFFYIPIIAIYLFIKRILNQKTNQKFKLMGMKRYLRYLKLILHKKVILSIILFSIISNTIVIFKNQKYENSYQEQEKIVGEALVISNPQEKEFSNRYKIKYKNTYFYLRVNKKLTESLEYGDKINLSGEFSKPKTRKKLGRI